ncbi:MAG: hypothetical protein ABIS06_04180 [Vicinamibacterales bacterium]
MKLMDTPNVDRDDSGHLVDQADTESLRTYVRALEARIVELESENSWLRHAAGSFGELAERFNAVLQRQRVASQRGR